MNALTLLNSVLANVPDPEMMKDLIFRWRDKFSLASVIQKQREVKDKDYKIQLDLFYTTTSQYLEAPALSKAQQLHEYEAQQPLLQVLVSELTHCYQVLESAQESGAFISARSFILFSIYLLHAHDLLTFFFQHFRCSYQEI